MRDENGTAMWAFAHPEVIASAGHGGEPAGLDVALGEPASER